MNTPKTIEQKIQKGIFDFFFKHNRSDLTCTFNFPKPANPLTRFAAIHASVLSIIEKQDFERTKRFQNDQDDEFEVVLEQKEIRRRAIRKSSRTFNKENANQKSGLTAI